MTSRPVVGKMKPRIHVTSAYLYRHTRRPGTSTLIDVQFVDSTNVLINFTSPVTINGNAPDTALTFISGTIFVTAVSVVTPIQIQATLSGVVTEGDTWSMTGQPNWLVTHLTNLPANGVIGP